MNSYSPEFLKFLAWEQASRDTIDFKKVYVDVVDDLIAGLALSELIYWYLPDKSGASDKLRVQHDGHMWIACRRYEWWERTRMSPKQADRAIGVLKKRGIVVTRVYKFSGTPTVHIRLNQDRFLKLIWDAIEHPPDNPFFPKGENGNSPKGKMEIPQKGKFISPTQQNRSSRFEKNDFPQRERSLTEITASTPASINPQEGRGARRGWPAQPAPAGEEEPGVQTAGPGQALALYQAVMGRAPTKTAWRKVVTQLGALPAELYPPSPDYLRLYQAITGNELEGEVPVSQWPLIVAALHQLPAEKRTREFLLPFWQKWCAIGASAHNVEWLTDCALNNRAPGARTKRPPAATPAEGGAQRRYADERYQP